MTPSEQVARRIDSYRNDMTNMQIGLCALPAIAPSSGGEGETKKGEYLMDFLRANGFQDISLVKAPDLESPSGYRPNILAYVKGVDSSRTIWVMTHTDVVPPGEMSQWKGNPYKAWVEQGRVYGRGTEDNHQDLVASLFAAKAFLAEGLKPAFDVGLALVADEETGSEKGIHYVLQHSSPFRKKDIIIVPDAGSEDGRMIEVAEKSILWLKFTTAGRQAHGSTPEKGLNSFKAASYLVTELDKLHRLFPEEDPLFDPPRSTFEPTKKEANVPNINTIPGEDVFFTDNRILPGYPVEAVEKAVGRIIRKVELRFGVKIQVEIEQKAPAAPPTPANAEVVRLLKKAVHDVYSVKSKPMGIGGGTVAAFFRRSGFQAACWSKIEDTAHMPNEYCVIDNMVGDAKVFAHVFLQQ
jgi:succinyl-diaminopimelate desuccinylase